MYCIVLYCIVMLNFEYWLYGTKIRCKIICFCGSCAGYEKPFQLEMCNNGTKLSAEGCSVAMKCG